MEMGAVKKAIIPKYFILCQDIARLYARPRMTSLRKNLRHPGVSRPFKIIMGLVPKVRPPGVSELEGVSI